MGLTQSVEGLQKNDRGSLKTKEFCLQTTIRLKSATSTFAGISILLFCPVGFRFVTSYNHMSQFLKINLSLYILVVLLLWRTLPKRSGEVDMLLRHAYVPFCIY